MSEITEDVGAVARRVHPVRHDFFLARLSADQIEWEKSSQ